VALVLIVQVLFMVRRVLDKQLIRYNSTSRDYEMLPEPRQLDNQHIGMLLPAVIALQVNSCNWDLFNPAP
jgi:hypothetical protein